jgi:CDP-6-deoxy-D-xylo-4-hexulose-3-dehydrase
MVNSGASANDITMLALKEMFGVGEVVVPALTWVSDVASVMRAGLTPKLVDINPITLGVDSDKVKSAITKKTKAIFITHILGFDALDDDLLSLLESQKILLIEDVCESHGATHLGKKLGSIGFASNFSFYFAHHMSTIEGGMISSNDEEFIDVCRMMRSHGLVRESKLTKTRDKFVAEFPELNREFIFKYAAHNMRPTELNAILGISQLKRLDENIVKRNRNFCEFLNLLDSNIFQTEFRIEGMSNYAFTLILREPNIQKRDRVEKLLQEAKIEFRRGLSGGGNQIRQPYFIEKFGKLHLSDYQNVEHVHHFSWYLGNYPDLPEKNFEILSRVLKQMS